MTAAETALRDYYRSSFATSALNVDGTINSIRANAWANNHADILAQFPSDPRANSTTLAARRVAVSSCQRKPRRTLKRLAPRASATEAEVDRSAIGTLIREDPRDVAAEARWAA